MQLELEKHVVTSSIIRRDRLALAPRWAFGPVELMHARAYSTFPQLGGGAIDYCYSASQLADRRVNRTVGREGVRSI